jgi:hypothetical protein
MLKCRGTNQSQTILTNMPNQMGGNKNNPKPPKAEKPAKVEPVLSPELQAEADKKAKLKHDLDLLNAKNENLRLEKELRDLENKPQKEEETKKSTEESEAAKTEAKAEADRQSDLKKRISLSSYAALKATGPNLHTDTTHKYLKKNWFGQAMDVAESKFQRLREATFGSITTAKETYQHRITRDHAMVATYEARFTDIKRSYIQAFEEMTGRKYTDLQNLTEEEIQNLDFDNENLDPKMKKAYKSIQSPEILLKKISRVEDVLAQINAPEIAEKKEGKKDAHGNILMNPDDSPIEEVVVVEGKPSLMEVAKDKNFKPQSKQDSKLVSHQFYKLLDVCENELLKLSNFEKAQTVSNLKEGITALVGAKFPKRSEESPTINNIPEPAETATNLEQLTQRQSMMMDLFGDKYQFQVQSFGYNGNGDVLFMMIKNEDGNIEQIMLNRKLNLDEQAIISQIKAGLMEVGNTVEYKNYDLHYTSKNSTSSKPEFSPIITPTAQNSRAPEAQNNIVSNPNDIEKYKTNIEKGDMDYLVDKFFTEHTPSTLNGIQTSTKDNVLYDIQVKMEGTDEYKYLAITMDDANTKDHSLFNQLKQLKNSDPSIVITIKNGRIDLENPQSPEPTPATPVNNTEENEKLAEPAKSINEVAINIANFEVKKRDDMAKKYFGSSQPLSIYSIQTSPIEGNMYQLGVIQMGKNGIEEYHTIQIPTGAIEGLEMNFFNEMSNNIKNGKVVNINNGKIKFENNFNLSEVAEPKIETSAVFEPIAPIIPEPAQVEVLATEAQPEESQETSQENKPDKFERVDATKGSNINVILKALFTKEPNLLVTGVNKENPKLLDAKIGTRKIKIELNSESISNELLELIAFKKSLNTFKNDTISSQEFQELSEQLSNENFAKKIVEDIQSNEMLKKFFQGTFGDDKIKSNMVLNLKIDGITKNVTLLSHDRDDEAKTKKVVFSAQQSFFDPAQLELVKQLADKQLSFNVVGGEVYMKDNKGRNVYNLKTKEGKEQKTGVTHEPIFTLE